jgi:hypothetical protein
MPRLPTGPTADSFGEYSASRYALPEVAPENQIRDALGKATTPRITLARDRGVQFFTAQKDFIAEILIQGAVWNLPMPRSIS